MTQRLLELAKQAAQTNHSEIYRYSKRTPEEIVDGHAQEFDTCPHSDCVLVRSAGLVPPPWEDKWQPMETAPKDGTDILAFDCGLCIVTSWVEVDGWQGWWETGKCEPPPTHWMPLPSSPLRSPKET